MRITITIIKVMSMWDDHDAHMLWLDRWLGSCNRNYNDVHGDGNDDNDHKDDADIFFDANFVDEERSFATQRFPP